MKVTPIKTKLVSLSSTDIFSLLDIAVMSLTEKSVVALTSKIVSLCEGRALPISSSNKEELVIKEAEYYLPEASSQYGLKFTITKNTLIPNSGIDESNGGGYYVLWPADPQKSANDIRKYLKNRHGLKHVGVLITDSTCMLLRRGTIGIAIALSGFKPLNDYVGKPDLFGRPFIVSRAGVASGLAAAAVVAMGEGDEQTPIAILEDLPFIRFQDRDPTAKDINELLVDREDDLFEPFLNAVDWKKSSGDKK